MTYQKVIRILAFFFLIVIFSYSVLALPASFYGSVTIDSVESTDATAVAVNASGTTATDAVGTVGCGTGLTNCYLISIPCTSGTVVTLRAFDIFDSNQTCNPGTVTNINLSVSTTANGVACTYDGSCTSGFCVSGSCCSTRACPTTTTTTTSGGGGGGGTTTTTTTTTAIEETQTISSIAAGGSATTVLEKSDNLKIEKITIEVQNSVVDVKITVKESSLPTGANLAISTDEGSTYKYLEIEKENIDDSNILSVKTRFKVEKSWITDNNINSTTVALHKYSDEQWGKLSTIKLSEDSNYIYYEAESPGLSIFAIAGEKKTGLVEACSYDCCVDEDLYEDKLCDEGYECQDNSCVEKEVVEDEEPGRDWTWLWILIGVIVLVIIGGGVAAGKKKKKK